MSNFLTRNSIFDDIFRDLTSGFYVKPLHGDSLPRSIRVDVTENDEVFQVQAELPGVSKENIDVKNMHTINDAFPKITLYQIRKLIILLIN